jgi:hypothetical protein
MGQWNNIMLKAVSSRQGKAGPTLKSAARFSFKAALRNHWVAFSLTARDILASCHNVQSRQGRAALCLQEDVSPGNVCIALPSESWGLVSPTEWGFMDCH